MLHNGDFAFFRHKQRQMEKKVEARKRARGDLKCWDKFLDGEKVYISA